MSSQFNLGKNKRGADTDSPTEKKNLINGSPSKKVEMISQLERMKQHTILVADTGDFEQLKHYQPQDSTTNPTLLLQASQMPQYKHLLDEAVQEAFQAKEEKSEEEYVEDICDRLAVGFGAEILKIIPGVVSTEVDASLSFDTEGSLKKARKLINLYEEKGVKREKILVKMASTWESCQAARILEQEGIHCNMTLLFCLAQAVAAAEAGASLISPFVGRILDWHKKKFPDKVEKMYGSEDPGVQSVKEIYKYYKKFGYKTIVMGASFRNTSEIIALSGCDKLTISPQLLGELKNNRDSFELALSTEMDFGEIKKIAIDEKSFRWMLNEDSMATEKLAEGIRNFNQDLLKLKEYIRKQIKKE